MNLIRQFFFASSTLLVMAQPSLAIQVLNQPPPAPAKGASTNIVERVGTINAVDLAKKFIVIDRVKYALSLSPVAIHALTDKDTGQHLQLKAGMNIRFNTSKANFAMQEQVQEIWVTSLGAKPAKK